MPSNEKLVQRLYRAKDAIQYVIDNCPDGGPLGDLEEAIEIVGRSADEIEAGGH